MLAVSKVDCLILICIYWSCIFDWIASFSDCHYCCFGSFNCFPCYGLCHSFFFFQRLPCVESGLFLFSSLPYLRFLSFYLWFHVMLFTWKDDNSTGSFWLCCLFYMLFIIYVYIYLCTRVCLYMIMVYTDGMTISKCLCSLLAAIGMVCHWFTAYCLWYASII